MASLSMSEFQRLVRGVMDALPAEFRPYLDNVVVEVADWADDDLLRKAGFTEPEVEAGETLLGLFEPFEMPTDGVDFTDHPHKLWIFKCPHEEEFPDPRRLRTEVKKTVVHELAHHFGWTDRDLKRFDANPDPFDED